MLELWSPAAPVLRNSFFSERWSLFDDFAFFARVGRWRDEGSSFVMELDLPGYAASDVRVDVDERFVRVRAAHADRDEGGSGLRSWHVIAKATSIPYGADERTLEAALVDGRLTVRISKRTSRGRRSIPIVGSASEPRSTAGDVTVRQNKPLWQRVRAGVRRLLARTPAAA